MGMVKNNYLGSEFLLKNTYFCSSRRALCFRKHVSFTQNTKKRYNITDMK